MTRAVRAALAVLLALLTLAACGRDDDSATTTTASDREDTACDSEQPEATDIGVTEDEIVIEVSADTGSPLAPGLFQGNVDAMKAFVERVNDQGGLACRELVLKAWDSKLNADESKNGQIDACGSALAMVGSNSLFNPDMGTALNCPDANGDAVGLPDIVALANSTAQQCNPTSFIVQAIAEQCKSTGERSFDVMNGYMHYFIEEFGEDLHGIYLVPGDLPTTVQNSMANVASLEKLGVGWDAKLKVSGRDEQAAYTPRIQVLRQMESNFVFNGSNDRVMISVRKEAKAQGVDSVELWVCSLACYTKNMLASGGADVEGTYATIQFLPFEEADENEELQAYLDGVGADKADSFGAQAWQAGVLFKTAIEQIVERDGINGITRKSLMEELRSIDSFDANGWSGAKGLRGTSPCYILLQIQDGKFARVHPKEPGTMDCDKKNLTTVTLDPAAEAAKIG